MCVLFPRDTWKIFRKYPVCFLYILIFFLRQESSSSTTWPDSMQNASSLLNGMVLELIYAPSWSRVPFDQLLLSVLHCNFFMWKQKWQMLLILRKDSSCFISVETKFLSIPKVPVEYNQSNTLCAWVSVHSWACSLLNSVYRCECCT